MIIIITKYTSMGGNNYIGTRNVNIHLYYTSSGKKLIHYNIAIIIIVIKRTILGQGDGVAGDTWPAIRVRAHVCIMNLDKAV